MSSNTNGNNMNMMNSGMMNMMSTGLLMTQLTNMLTKSEEFDYRQLWQIIVLMSVDEIKNFITVFTGSLRGFIQNKDNYNPKKIYGHICVIFGYLLIAYIYLKNYMPDMSRLYCYSKKTLEIEETKKEKKEPEKKNTKVSTDICFSPGLPFMQSFVKYCNSNDIQSDISVNKITIKNLEEKTILEDWQDIKIIHNSVEIHINEKLKLSFKNSRFKTELSQFNSISELSCGKYFSDLLRNKLPGNIRVVADTLHAEAKSLLEEEKVDKKWLATKYTEYFIMECLKKTIPDFNLEISTVEFAIFCRSVRANSDNMNINSFISQNVTNILDIPYNYKKFGGASESSKGGYTSYPRYIEQSVKIDDNIHDDFYMKFIPYMLASLKKPINNTDNGFTVTLSSNTHTKKQLVNEFNSFCDVINETSLMHKSNKSNIYLIKLHKYNVETFKDNPEYEEYLEKKDMINKLTDKKESNSDSDEEKKDDKEKKKKPQYPNFNYDFFYEQTPPKKIKSIEKKVEVNVKHINEISKSFDTLYLRQEDKFKLKTTLEQFKEHKELLKELGLPNKLGVMLAGEPGTGKTSVIYTIASYLQKDVFYVNMKNINSNSELQMIFDYVNKNCVNGGIIIFEEIDKQTKIVRKDYMSKMVNNEQNVADIYEEQSELTLDYFLNLLQGALTQDNSIFIATTNHIEDLEPAFYRDGRFDVNINMKLCDHFQIQSIYEKFMKHKIPDDIISRIPEDKFTPAKFIFRIKDYIFGNYDDKHILKPFISEDKDTPVLVQENK